MTNWTTYDQRVGRQPRRKTTHASNPMQTAMLVIIAVSTLTSAVVNAFWTYEVLQLVNRLSQLGG